MIGRIAALLYAIVCYLVFFVTFLYSVVFLGDFGFFKSIDSGAEGPSGLAFAINASLLALFAAQHSVMARPWFKRAWTRIVPPAVERSTYVLFSSLALVLLFWQWQPMGGVVWQADNTVARFAIWTVYALGWALLLVSTSLINHFDLFGLRQAYLYAAGRPAAPLPFRTPGLYRYVRHPIYLSWLCIFWATPQMTVAHLVFALATTAYMLIAIQWEERDLIGMHGDLYRSYRERVPKILPLRAGWKPLPEPAAVPVAPEVLPPVTQPQP